MVWHWEDIYGELRAAATEQQVFHQIAACAQDLGFEYCCYGIRVPIPVSKPAVVIFDTYPSGWMDHYQGSGFLEIDPTVRQGMRSTQMIVWSDETFSAAPRLWADAHDHGLVVGAAQPCWGAHGVFGLLTVSRAADRMTIAEISQLAERGSWLANLAHTLMSNFLLPKLVPELQVRLTPREREVLRWTGEGKTACEIGQILNIADRTVNFHINNILLKLAATNKIQAVVKAVTVGLIDLP
ncbi:autoinducer binding domain-containing protein [Paraburkholderia azotifigens]|uniref:autoinducer binding domain-containing protein n=1 Tax=Paraburkholderia azotifigens TaxID=2057004 RepID=UPI00317366E7